MEKTYQRETQSWVAGQPITNFRLFFTQYTEWEQVKGFQRITEAIGNRTVTYTQGALEQLHHQQTIHLRQLTEPSVVRQLTPYKGVIAGYGEPSVYDTGLKLDVVFGFPYIPASSWQGVIRNWLINQYFAGDEAEALADTGFLHLFGSEEQAGNILFLDAYPKILKSDSIKPDVFTPHFGAYYTSGKPPTDELAPVPVLYLVVKNTSFVFRFGYERSRCKRIDRFPEGEFKNLSPLELLNDELPHIFRYYGVGARTKNGFGRGEIEDVAEP